MNINGKRVVAAGLLAGLVMMIGTGVGEAAFAAEYGALLEGFGLPPLTTFGVALLTVGGFILGVILVWMYALVRTHYGSGFVAVGITAGVAWMLACFIPATGLLAFQFITPRLFALGLGTDLVSVGAATAAGAWGYGFTRAAARQAVTPAAG